MRSLGRLAILTEELTLQYSPIILKALSCMQQGNACQPYGPALPQKEASSQSDNARSHQVRNLERGPNATAEIEAEAAAAAVPRLEAMVEGTTAAAAAPGAEALIEGSAAGSAAQAVRPVHDQTRGYKGSAASEMPPECLQAVQNTETTSVRSQATKAEQDSAPGTPPLSSPELIAAATTISSSALQAALGAVYLPPAPTTTAASLKQVPSQASEPAHAAATTSAAVAGATAAAPEAEAVVLEAVSAAAASLEAFPHLLGDVGEALGHQLRCAIGELCRSSPTPSTPLPPRTGTLLHSVIA